MIENTTDLDNFAIVEFKPDSEDVKKNFVEVVRYEWLTDECTEVLCPKDRNWKIELKSSDGPKPAWKKYACRVLKSNIHDLKTAHMECQLRLNYTSDSLDSSSIELDNADTGILQTKTKDSTKTDYSQVFNKCAETEEPSPKLQPEIRAQNKFLTQDIPVTIVEKEIATEEHFFEPHNQQEHTLLDENLSPIDTEWSGTNIQQHSKLLVVPEDSVNTILQELSILREEILKLSVQNETIMKMMADGNKRKLTKPLFKIISEIKTELDLNHFEEKLREEDYRKNMAYEYTQFVWKGDAKKEVNGFVKSIIQKLFHEEFLKKIRWDRLSKKCDSAPDKEDNIFLKKYVNLLSFMTDCCNINKKDSGIYYNKDNISNATQDFFKRFVSKKKETHVSI